MSIRSAMICAVASSMLVAQIPAPHPRNTSGTGRIEAGRLANCAAVFYTRSGSGDWGLELSGGGSRLTQPKPVQIEIYRGRENASLLVAGYSSVRQQAGYLAATGEPSSGAAIFSVENRWKVSGAVLSLNRRVYVAAAENAPGSFRRSASRPRRKWRRRTPIIWLRACLTESALA
jgi:hypothetical protein